MHLVAFIMFNVVIILSMRLGDCYKHLTHSKLIASPVFNHKASLCRLPPLQSVASPVAYNGNYFADGLTVANIVAFSVPKVVPLLQQRLKRQEENNISTFTGVPLEPLKQLFPDQYSETNTGAPKPTSLYWQEYRKVVRSLFSHSDIDHLVTNTWMLHDLSPLVQKTFGFPYVVCVWLTAGIVGNLDRYCGVGTGGTGDVEVFCELSKHRASLGTYALAGSLLMQQFLRQALLPPEVLIEDESNSMISRNISSTITQQTSQRKVMADVGKLIACNMYNFITGGIEGGSGDSSQDTHHQPLDVSGTCVALAVGAAAASLQAWWLGLPIQ